MSFILLLFLIIALSLVIYLFLDDDDNDWLQVRIKKFASPKQNIEAQKNEKVNPREELFKLIEPFVSGLLKQKNNMKSVRQLLLEAGYPSGEEEATKFMVKKVALGLFGLFMGLFLFIINKSNPMLAMLSLIVCVFGTFKMPDFKIKREAKVRAEEITYSLPDALDLLTVCVEAGLGLDAALSRVSNEFSRSAPILAKELGRVNKDILSGVSRQEAFRNLSSRNNVPDLKSFSALLIQTDKLGTSIAQSLRVYSDTVRTKRRQRVEALAAKASVKMIIPMVLFILPSMFIVLLGPAAINLMKTFGSSAIGK